jgi:hypothetical protein
MTLGAIGLHHCVELITRALPAWHRPGRGDNRPGTGVPAALGRAGSVGDEHGGTVREQPDRLRPWPVQSPRLRPMRGLKRDRSTQILAAGHAFLQNAPRPVSDRHRRTRAAPTYRRVQLTDALMRQPCEHQRRSAIQAECTIMPLTRSFVWPRNGESATTCHVCEAVMMAAARRLILDGVPAAGRRRN